MKIDNLICLVRLLPSKHKYITENVKCRVKGYVRVKGIKSFNNIQKTLCSKLADKRSNTIDT